jgi:hypothetical protein
MFAQLHCFELYARSLHLKHRCLWVKVRNLPVAPCQTCQKTGWDHIWQILLVSIRAAQIEKGIKLEAVDFDCGFTTAGGAVQGEGGHEASPGREVFLSR